MFEQVDHKLLRHVFIGYDDREEEAYQACRYSILSRTDKSLINIIPLRHQELRKLKLFLREWKTTSEGSFVDLEDKRPFSTQFSHSRFLIPELAKYLKLKGFALFIDCDFLFLSDIKELFNEAEKQHKIVSVVKHNYSPGSKLKMDDREQTKYNRKLWSALMVFALDEPSLYERLNKNYVNSATGRDLHTFKFLGNEEMSELEIGSIGEEWQFIPDHSEERIVLDNIKAIHYTEGGPWFPHMENCKYSNLWWKAYREYVSLWLYPWLETKV